MTSENEALRHWERLYELERQLMELVPPIRPPACHWLNSDATYSYCYEHARAARWNELPTTGPCPPELDYSGYGTKEWNIKRDMENLISEGIDGCAGMGSESDCSESCETCGRTLEYLLTDYGVSQELDHYANCPITPDEEINGERTYELSRIFMNMTWDGADAAQVAECIVIAESAVSNLLAARKERNEDGNDV